MFVAAAACRDIAINLVVESRRSRLLRVAKPAATAAMMNAGLTSRGTKRLCKRDVQCNLIKLTPRPPVVNKLTNQDG